MSGFVFLRDLAVVLSLATGILLLFRRLGQPPVLGYLLAGVIVGPVAALSLEVLGEIGVVFLLFSLGVEFNLKRLWSLGARPLFCAAVEAGLMLAAGYWIGGVLGWKSVDSLLLGGVAALASTAIVARTLLARAKSLGWEDLAAGMLIAEDLIAVLLIAFFASMARLGTPSLSAVKDTLLDFSLLTILILVTGLIALPRILRLVERSGMEEARSLAVVGICFGVSATTHALGFSSALGAFLAGAMCSTGHARGLEETVAPFRDVFGAVFFVSVGMLIDPAWLTENWPLALGLTAALTFVRYSVNFTALALAGESTTSCAQASLAMLPIGEFSFILAQLAQNNALSAQPIYPIAVSLCLATTLISALALPRADGRLIARLMPARLEEAHRSYRARLAGFTASASSAHVWPLLRPSIVQIAINALGIAGYFVALAAADRAYGLQERLGQAGLLWLAAALLCLPFLNALIRKSQAVALVLLEAMGQPGGRTPMEAYPVLTRLLLSLIGLAIGFWALGLSVPLLPAWPSSAVPLIVAALAGTVLWKRTSRLYALIQRALRESVADRSSFDAAANAMAVFTSAATEENAKLESFKLERQHWAAGRTLVEINLRALTGASLLQITRRRERLTAPHPRSQLLAGDELLLIGQSRHLAAAKKLLLSGPEE